MDSTIRSRSLIISVFIHAAILLILIFTIMKTPVPPFPETGEGGGVLVNIGTVDEASGEFQPASIVTSPQPVVETKSSQTKEEQYVTQDVEEAPVVKEKKDDKVKTQKTEVAVVK